MRTDIPQHPKAISSTARLVVMVAQASSQPLNYTQLALLTGSTPGTLGKIVPVLVNQKLIVRTTIKGISYFSTPERISTIASGEVRDAI